MQNRFLERDLREICSRICGSFDGLTPAVVLHAPFGI